MIAAVIGDVPAGAFELKRRRRDYLLQSAAASLVYGQRGIGKFLSYFETLTAPVTLVFVKGHFIGAKNPQTNSE